MHINHLSISIDTKPIIHDIDLTIGPGTIHVLMGPNGSGKSSLAYALMGHPRYTIDQGSVLFKDQDITDFSPDKRAKLGLFLAFQYPQEISGVSVFTFLKEAYALLKNKPIEVGEFQELLLKTMDMLKIDHNFAYRNVNEGFSGGEKKKLEILQIVLFEPALVIFDEIDSGLDIDALKLVSQNIIQLKKHNPEMSMILITHYQRLLEWIVPDYVHILRNGRLIGSGDRQLVDQIEREGYDAYGT